MNIKKSIFFFTLIMFSLLGNTQILPFMDVNDYLKVFYKGQARQLEFQRVNSFQFGDHVLAYQNSANDLMYYNGENVKKVTNLIVNYQLSDTYLVVKASNGLYIVDNDGKPRNLTMYANNFIVKDSLVLFEDTQLNSWNIYYKGNVRTLFQSTGLLSIPAFVGDNIVVFKDNGDEWKVFYKDKIYTFGVWMSAINFVAGTNIACLNDPTMGTFAVFENGEFMDVEPQFVKSYKAGKDFIVYEDINGGLMYYSKGEKLKITSFPSSYDVVDEVILFTENGRTYTFYDKEKVELCSYIPKDYLLKNQTICFRNIMGGVTCFINGKLIELTTQQDSKYVISGNYVLVELFNRSYLVYADDKTYEF